VADFHMMNDGAKCVNYGLSSQSAKAEHYIGKIPEQSKVKIINFPSHFFPNNLLISPKC